jgi:hypothetical protein
MRKRRAETTQQQSLHGSVVLAVAAGWVVFVAVVVTVVHAWQAVL